MNADYMQHIVPRCIAYRQCLSSDSAELQKRANRAKFKYVLIHVFLVLIFWTKTAAGATVFAFCNYGHQFNNIVLAVKFAKRGLLASHLYEGIAWL